MVRIGVHLSANVSLIGLKYLAVMNESVEVEFGTPPPPQIRNTDRIGMMSPADGTSPWRPLCHVGASMYRCVVYETSADLDLVPMRASPVDCRPG